jgi:hypothetical protein
MGKRTVLSYVPLSVLLFFSLLLLMNTLLPVGRANNVSSMTAFARELPGQIPKMPANLSASNLTLAQPVESGMATTENRTAGLQSEQNTTDAVRNQIREEQITMAQTAQPPQATTNQTGETGQLAINETGDEIGEVLSNVSKPSTAQNSSQRGQAIANQSGEASQLGLNDTGDILSQILRGERGLFE